MTPQSTTPKSADRLVVSRSKQQQEIWLLLAMWKVFLSDLVSGFCGGVWFFGLLFDSFVCDVAWLGLRFGFGLRSSRQNDVAWLCLAGAEWVHLLAYLIDWQARFWRRVGW